MIMHEFIWHSSYVFSFILHSFLRSIFPSFFIPRSLTFSPIFDLFSILPLFRIFAHFFNSTIPCVQFHQFVFFCVSSIVWFVLFNFTHSICMILSLLSPTKRENPISAYENEYNKEKQPNNSYSYVNKIRQYFIIFRRAIVFRYFSKISDVPLKAL